MASNGTPWPRRSPRTPSASTPRASPPSAERARLAPLDTLDGERDEDSASVTSHEIRLVGPVGRRLRASAQPPRKAARKLIANHVAGWQIDLVVCSPAKRATATAKPL